MADANGTATIYVRWHAIATTTASDSTPVDGVTNPPKVMLNGDAAGGSCYKSEAYYVSGQALPPTAFGYDYENQGKWAPLDSAVIKQNITDAGGLEERFYLPFNPAATGQVFSSSVTSTSAYVADSSAAAMFNGVAAPGAQNRAETSSARNCNLCVISSTIRWSSYLHALVLEALVQHTYDLNVR